MSRIWGSNSRNNLNELWAQKEILALQALLTVQRSSKQEIKYLLEMTLRWSSCLSKVAKAHRPPYTAALLGDKSCTETQDQLLASWAYSKLSPAKQKAFVENPCLSPTAPHICLFHWKTLCWFYTPLDSHSGQKKPAGSTLQLVYICERPTLPDLKTHKVGSFYGCTVVTAHCFNNITALSPSHLQHTLTWWGLLDSGCLAHLFAKQKRNSSVNWRCFF